MRLILSLEACFLFCFDLARPLEGSKSSHYPSNASFTQFQGLKRPRIKVFLAQFWRRRICSTVKLSSALSPLDLFVSTCFWRKGNGRGGIDLDPVPHFVPHELKICKSVAVHGFFYLLSLPFSLHWKEKKNTWHIIQHCAKVGFRMIL